LAKTYLPKFDAPENPYTGPEAGMVGGEGYGNGTMGGGSGGMTDDLFGNVDMTTTTENEAPGTVVPSFMTCPSSSDNNQQCCNGSPANCPLPLDEMMFGMVHNAMSSEEGDFIIGYNHYYGLEKALVAGYRGINLDVCSCGGVLQFCHNVCDLGERMPNEVFTNTLQFLNDYPSEVLVLLFEASSEQGPISWSDLYSEMANVDGFTDLLYVHTEGQAWPTMGELVSSNKRIIVFYFNGGSCDNDVCPSEFHPWFTYAAETQFESASLNDLQDYEYSCQVTRGPGSTSDEKTQQASFLVVNNFVTPPDPDAAAVANSKDFLANRLAECANLSGKRPNFVYLDFWSEGVTAELVQYANAQYAEELSSGQ